MAIPINKKLYEKAKQIADEIYKKSSAYKSMFIVKKYKEMGGKYGETKEKNTDGLTRWKDEQWIDIGNKSYPVYRPTKRINKNTPLTVDEIDESNLKEQIKLKQKYEGDRNLPPFKQKYISIKDVPLTHEIYNYSNPIKLRKIADSKGFKKDTIYLSDNPNKKYMLFHPKTNKKIHFGQMGYQDLLYHNDELRRMRFKNRNKKWNDFDKYTPAYISYNLLW
jgi:hypothetical protein